MGECQNINSFNIARWSEFEHIENPSGSARVCIIDGSPGGTKNYTIGRDSLLEMTGGVRRVPQKSLLYKKSTWNIGGRFIAYNGMLASVYDDSPDNNGIYMADIDTSDDIEDESRWVKIGPTSNPSIGAFVSYEPQTLTHEQSWIARRNIGASSVFVGLEDPVRHDIVSEGDSWIYTGDPIVKYERIGGLWISVGDGGGAVPYPGEDDSSDGIYDAGSSPSVFTMSYIDAKYIPIDKESEIIIIDCNDK